MLVQKVNDCNFTNSTGNTNNTINENQSYKLKYSTQYGTIIDTTNITILDLHPSTTEKENEEENEEEIDYEKSEQIPPQENTEHNSENNTLNNITHTYSTQNYSLTDIDTQGRFAVFSCDYDLCYAILDMKTGLFFKDAIASTSDEISVDSAFLLDIETNTFHYLHTKMAPPENMSMVLHKILAKNHTIHLREL